MKKISIFLSVCIIIGIVFYALDSVSKNNEYTSVRAYGKKIVDTVPTETGAIIDTEPPIIDILNYKNKDVVTSDSIDIQVQVSDAITPSSEIVITGAGEHTLTLGYNPITVSARDTSGNIAVKYIIIEKK